MDLCGGRAENEIGPEFEKLLPDRPLQHLDLAGRPLERYRERR